MRGDLNYVHLYLHLHILGDRAFLVFIDRWRKGGGKIRLVRASGVGIGA